MAAPVGKGQLSSLIQVNAIKHEGGACNSGQVPSEELTAVIADVTVVLVVWVN